MKEFRREMKAQQQRHPDTKVEVLRRRLYEIALEKGPGAQLPTVRTLCDLLMTTRVTLAEALDMLEEQNVLCRKKRQGIFVSPKIYHKSICVLFDGSLLITTGASPFWSMLWVLIAQEAQRRAAEKDETYTFHMVMPGQITAETPLPQDIMNMIQAERVHGVMTIGLGYHAISWITSCGIPCITFAGMGEGAWLVALNNEEMLRLAVGALAEAGCRRIGYWLTNWDFTANEDYRNSDDVQGFRACLEACGITYEPELVRMYRPGVGEGEMRRGPAYQEQGYQLVKEVFGGTGVERPEGLFISNDMVTDGVLAAFEELGVRVGQDVTIATHANVGSPILFARTRNLIVVEHDPGEIVKTMFGSLDRLLVGEEPEERMIHLKPRLRGERG